jgi:uncharacterized protein YecE (DUF72 family)
MVDWRLGTSSWSEADWVGPFYPPGTPPGLFLAHYAQRFRAVEADVTYYRVPDRKLCAGWNDRTPADFKLCAKFPRSVVHGGKSASPDASLILDSPGAREDSQRFLEALGVLGTKLGPVLLQFPYFNRQAFGSPTHFLERLERFLETVPREFRVAVEVRNKAWLGLPLVELLRRRSAALTLVDLNYMPDPADWAPLVGGDRNLCTASFLYCRLIGDRKRTEAAAERFDRTVLDLSGRIARWAELLARLAPGVEEVFAFANNHYAGYAPDTVDSLAAALGV